MRLFDIAKRNALHCVRALPKVAVPNAVKFPSWLSTLAQQLHKCRNILVIGSFLIFIPRIKILRQYLSLDHLPVRKIAPAT